MATTSVRRSGVTRSKYDDNDLEQARIALKTTDIFFKMLYYHAEQLNMTPYQFSLRKLS